LKSHDLPTNTFSTRDYELSIFKNCRIEILSRFQQRMLFDTRLRFKILRKLTGCNLQIVKQNENEYITIEKIFKSIYIDGYFQSEKYFSQIRRRIIDEFSFPELDNQNSVINNRILKDENSVSIHIRRGDYLKEQVLEYHGVLPLSYYSKSINELNSMFESLTFYFFSDDPEFVKENFNNVKNKILIEGNVGSDSWKDICLMKSCKHHIIANSSFSWWGAWLSERNGITLAPEKWFNPEIANFDINDIVPNDWKLIDYE